VEFFKVIFYFVNKVLSFCSFILFVFEFWVIVWLLTGALVTNMIVERSGLRTMLRHLLINLVILFFAVDIFVRGDETDYQRGLQLIRSGQLEESVPFFQKALRAEPDNDELQKEFNELRQIVKLRQTLPTEKNAVQWNIGAECLRRYYAQHHVVSEHLKLVLEIHYRVGTISRAIDVIDAFLKEEQYQEALDFVLSQKQPEQILPLRIEKARIYYEAGEKDQAQKIVRSIPFEELNSPESLFRLARIQSRTLQYASAIRSLKRCFELTPSNILPLIKKEAEKCVEFRPILSSSEFVEVMSTRSLVFSNEMNCAKKWTITSSFGEPPQHFQKILQGEIDFNDWRLH
jgi:tetratricopeptide (TPR) repeat protein